MEQAKHVCAPLVERVNNFTLSPCKGRRAKSYSGERATVSPFISPCTYKSASMSALLRKRQKYCIAAK